MTNIVGGNTGNLSQPGSSQDGSSSNPLTKNAGLDFLSLISGVATTTNQFVNKIKAVSYTHLTLPPILLV